MMSAMLPTYFWFQWKELVMIARNMGLTEEESKNTIQETLHAAINLMFHSKMSTDQVIDLIPVKPIADHESQIIDIFQTKLMEFFLKIST